MVPVCKEVGYLLLKVGFENEAGSQGGSRPQDIVCVGEVKGTTGDGQWEIGNFYNTIYQEGLNVGIPWEASIDQLDVSNTNMNETNIFAVGVSLWDTCDIVHVA